MRRDRRYGFGSPVPVGFEKLTVPPDHAVGFATIPPNATHAIIHVVGAAVRWRADADPTQLLGIRLEAASYWELMDFDLEWTKVLHLMRFISLGAGSELETQWFG